jgi:hypothetical protein
MLALRSFLVLLASPVLLALGTGPASAEQLSSPALPGFVVGHEAANDEQSIREEVPAGETVRDWTRMVTTQRFGGAAARITPVDFLANMSTNLQSACPGASNSRVITGTRGGRPAAQMRAFCPLFARSGEPESFIILAIAGAEDLHIKQVAFRRVPTEEDIAWGEGVLASVRYCDTGQAGDECPG